MKALAFAGIIQGFSTPLLMLMTENHGHPNKQPRINILGWLTTATIFSASIALVVSWFLH